MNDETPNDETPSGRPRRPNPVAATRGIVVCALLGGGSVVMMTELLNEHRELAIGAAAVAAALLVLMPRPIDVRSAVYAFFVPVTMAYGAATEHVALLLIGGAAGVFFLLEKRRPADGP